MPIILNYETGMQVDVPEEDLKGGDVVLDPETGATYTVPHTSGVD